MKSTTTTGGKAVLGRVRVSETVHFVVVEPDTLQQLTGWNFSAFVLNREGADITRAV